MTHITDIVREKTMLTQAEINEIDCEEGKLAYGKRVVGEKSPAFWLGWETSRYEERGVMHKQGKLLIDIDHMAHEYYSYGIEGHRGSITNFRTSGGYTYDIGIDEFTADELRQIAERIDELNGGSDE